MTTQASPNELLQRRREAFEFAKAMQASGLNEPFLLNVLQYALNDYRSVYELMALWSEADNEADRDAAVADLHDLLEDLSHKGPPTEKPKIKPGELPKLIDRIKTYKAKLRNLIDSRGGITKVSELCGIPQPSLSRMLNSASMPRKTTLYKIVAALGLPESEIPTDLAS